MVSAGQPGIERRATFFLGWCLVAAGVLLLPLDGNWDGTPLALWFRFAWTNDDASHVLVVIPIVFYLVRLRRNELPPAGTRGAIPILLLLAGMTGFMAGLGSATLESPDIKEPERLATRILKGSDSVAIFLRERFPISARTDLERYVVHGLSRKMRQSLARELNQVIGGPCIYQEARFATVELGSDTRGLLRQARSREGDAWLNRRLLEDVFAVELRRASGWLGGYRSSGLGLPSTAICVGLGPNARPVLAGFVLYLWMLAGAWRFFGGRVLKALLFAVCFLGFVIPVPDVLMTAVNRHLQFWTAEAAYHILRVTGQEVVLGGDNRMIVGGLALSGTSGTADIQVVEACSGFRSSMVLLMVGMLGAYLMLRSGWRRILVVAFSVPLGILRNGIRVAVLALMHVEFGVPLDSQHNLFHRYGGQPMFILSLVPLFALLIWLRKTEGLEARAGANATMPLPSRKPDLVE